MTSGDLAAVSQPRVAVEVSHLRKAYGPTVAVDDVSFSVAEGQIFGLLGPNGAGKTTTVECAVGLRRPDAGSLSVLGLDPTKDREELRLLVGVQLQASTLPARLKVGELLDLYQSFYPTPAKAEELAETLGLADKRDDFYRSLSGGQKQRLSIALALIGNPQLAVLDEMTTGLDPHARRETWELIEHVRDRGVTIVLVTHYMEEAERLCDQVALFDRGKVVAAGTPEELAQRSAVGTELDFVPSRPFDDRLLTDLVEVSGVAHRGRRIHVTGTGDLVTAVIQTLAVAGVVAHAVKVRSPTLEDAFIKLTGRPLALAPSSPPRGPDWQGSAPGERRPLLPAGVPRRAFAKLVQSEARLAWRQPIGLAFGLMLPLILLVIFGIIPSWREPNASLGGLSVLDTFLPVFIVLVLAVVALAALPIPLATYREQGILRRLSTTPVPPAWVLGAQLVVNGCIAVVAVTILVVVATAAFGLKAPLSLGGIVLSIALSGAALLGIGLLISGTARTAGGAGGCAVLLFYPLMFFAGLYVPLAEMPAIITDISRWTPLGAAVQAIQQSMLNGFPPASALLVMAGYAVVFGGLALRYFRWE